VKIDPVDKPTPTPLPSITFSYAQYAAPNLHLAFEGPAGWIADDSAADAYILTNPNPAMDYEAKVEIRTVAVGKDYTQKELTNEVKAQADTLRSQRLQDGRTRSIGAQRTICARNGTPGVEISLRKRAHPDTADADQMDRICHRSVHLVPEKVTNLLERVLRTFANRLAGIYRPLANCLASVLQAFSGRFSSAFRAVVTLGGFIFLLGIILLFSAIFLLGLCLLLVAGLFVPAKDASDTADRLARAFTQGARRAAKDIRCSTQHGAGSVAQGTRCTAQDICRSAEDNIGTVAQGAERRRQSLAD
jgi:hypothetical protein